MRTEEESIMLYDKDIREPLFEFLEDTYGKIRILQEKMMGKSRADVVMITPEALYGIEIKSDADTYERLSRQVRDYDRYYDFNFIVAGTRHAMHVEEHIPRYWGIITVEMVNGVPDFYILRKPASNPKVKWEKKLEILWRPELAHIQELNQMPKYKDKSKLFVIEKIQKRGIPEEVLRSQVSEELFQRDYNTIEAQLEGYRRSRKKRVRR